MPTLLSHPAVPLAIGLAAGSRLISPRLLFAGVVASILPDLDVLSFRFGIRYADAFGHRGVTHSLAFALAVGLLACFFARKLRSSRQTAFLFIFAATVSHGLLDMLTNAGQGIALLWPFSETRFFFPLQVIEASPLSLRRFMSARGSQVMVSEFLWVWLPAVIVGVILYLVRHYRRDSDADRREMSLR